MSDTSSPKADSPRTRKRARADQSLSIKAESVSKAFPALKAQQSRQQVDEFAGLYGSGLAQAEHQVVEPMYPPAVLNRHAMASGVLRSCIDAMATNIDGFGYTLEYVGPEDARQSEEVQQEYLRATGLLDHPNGEYSLTELRKRFRTDKESTGYGTIEVVRDQDDGFPTMLYHVPSHSVRMTTTDRQATEAKRYLPRPGADEEMMTVKSRFRRYVQVINGKRVFFRESGDPRPISTDTGLPLGDNPDESLVATDIVMDYLYVPGSRYGAPRWIGDLRSVLGIQESENVNLSYFKDNGIPAMLMLIMGGALSPASADRFKQEIQLSRGQDMQNKITMLEVEGHAEAASETGVVQRPELRVEHMTAARQQDAFFQEYEKSSAKKVRSTFRLPSMFTGITEEVRYSVAEASLTVAENQVFGPERGQTDDVFNYHVLTYSGRPMRFWRYRSNPPRISSEGAVLDALATFEDVGAMTPNIAIGIANEMFDLSISPIEEAWGDLPFSMTVSQNGKPQVEAGEEGEPVPNTQQTATARRRKRHRDASRKEGGIHTPKPRRRTRRQRSVQSRQGDTAAIPMEDANDTSSE